MRFIGFTFNDLVYFVLVVFWGLLIVLLGSLYLFGLISLLL